MSKGSPVAVFLAASAILATATTGCQSNLNQSSESSEKTVSHNHSVKESDDMGGLKEWTTDESVESEGKLDKAAKKAAKKAKEQDICIPVGEGENCW